MYHLYVHISMYVCIIFNVALCTYGYQIFLLIFFVVAPYNGKITDTIVNYRIIYTCYADGGPGNQYIWVNYENELFINSQQLVFTIKEQSNEGTYECTITNNAGTLNNISITFNGESNMSYMYVYKFCKNKLYCHIHMYICMYACKSVHIA